MLVAIGCVVLPAWAGVDYVAEPANFELFARMRVVCTAVMLALAWLLLFTRFGERHPEALVLTFLLVPETMIAVMIPRLDEAFAAYATGMSLALYGSAFLLIWSWRYTGVLIGASWLVLGLGVATAPDPPPLRELVTVATYLVSASAIATGGQWYRHHLAWRAFVDRADLIREQQRNRALVSELERLTREDGLTGLANRRCWDTALEREVTSSRRQGTPLALVLCDLDRFKEVNDSHGHPAGDEVLRQTAALLANRARGSDLVARLGGDEFGVMCPGTDLEGALRLAEELEGCARELRLPDGSPAPVAFSLGVAELQATDAGPDQLVLRADEQLYRVKREHAGVRALAER